MNGLRLALAVAGAAAIALSVGAIPPTGSALADGAASSGTMMAAPAGSMMAAPANMMAAPSNGMMAQPMMSAPAAGNPAMPAAQGPASSVAGAAAISGSDLTDDQRTEVEAIIRNYLIAHPEIIQDAINELQRRQDAAAQMAQTQAITDNKNLLFASGRQVVLGNPKGDVTLVEFFDYNCTYCRRAQADMKQLLSEDKNLRVVLKEFPVLGDGSVQAAQVAVAVNMVAPDKYAAFHEEMLGERGETNGKRALAVATDVGVDATKLKAAMSSNEVQATISEVYDLANKLSLTGTPSYVTSKEVIVGAVGYDALKEKIKAIRDCNAASC